MIEWQAGHAQHFPGSQEIQPLRLGLDKNDDKETAMRYEIDATELKGALGALLALTKKMPADGRGNGASVSLMRDAKGKYHLVTTHTWFHAMTALDGITCLTASRNNELEPYDGKPEESAWGFADPQAVLAVVSKLPKSATVTMTRKKGESKILLESGGNKSYEFQLADPTMSMSGYGMHDDGTVVCTLDEEGLGDFCQSATMMAALVEPSVTRPEFESLCLSSERPGGTGDKRLRMSVNISDKGMALVDTRRDVCKESFTALLPKETAGGLKGFVSQISNGGGADIVSYPAKAGEPKAKGIGLRGKGYELYLTCRTDDFPFAQINQILDTISSPSVSVAEPTKQFVDAFNRTSVLAIAGQAAVTLGITDAGALILEQHKGLLAKTILARETLDPVQPSVFPDDEAVVTTNVNANNLAKIVKLLDKREMTVDITGTSGLGILSLRCGETPHDGVCLVMAALRI